LTLFQLKDEDKDKINKELLGKIRQIAKKYVTNVEGKTIEELMDTLLEARENARGEKDWNTADGIRKDLGEIGFEIQDTDKGPVWRKK